MHTRARSSTSFKSVGTDFSSVLTLNRARKMPDRARTRYNYVVSAPELTIDDRAAGRVIESAREERGMPKAELARRSGVGLRTLVYYLQGERAMTLGTFRRLHEALGVTREEAGERLNREVVALEGTPEQ